jgi:hypothetical protein
MKRFEVFCLGAERRERAARYAHRMCTVAIWETHLLESSEIAEDTMAFEFQRPADFSFRAGQAVAVRLIEPPETDAKGNQRAFSIASAPSQDRIVVATRMRDTAFKRSLRKLSPGAKVQIRGPIGRFVLDPVDTAPAVMLAGGIGITPMLSMLRESLAAGHTRAIYLFYSNRTPGVQFDSDPNGSGRGRAMAWSARGHQRRHGEGARAGLRPVQLLRRRSAFHGVVDADSAGRHAGAVSTHSHR